MTSVMPLQAKVVTEKSSQLAASPFALVYGYFTEKESSTMSRSCVELSWPTCLPLAAGELAQITRMRGEMSDENFEKSPRSASPGAGGMRIATARLLRLVSGDLALIVCFSTDSTVPLSHTAQKQTMK